jgi:hypothetical protein
MNTNPDETTLALWLDDELQGEALAAFEAVARGDQELMARREGVRAWRRQIGAALPAVEEPPYPDFFNSRIEQALRKASPQPVAGRARTGSWRVWWLPAAAVAGMAVSFWLGTKTVGGPQVVIAPRPEPVPAVVQVAQAPAVYTPERGVAAEWFSSDEAAATVIVLEGLEALPDTLDFSETARVEGDAQSMAGMPQANDGRIRQ